MFTILVVLIVILVKQKGNSRPYGLTFYNGKPTCQPVWCWTTEQKLMLLDWHSMLYQQRQVRSYLRGSSLPLHADTA